MSVLFTMNTQSFAEEINSTGTQSASEERVRFYLTKSISKRIPRTNVELMGSVRWISGVAPEEIRKIDIVSESAQGELQFLVFGENQETPSEGKVNFAAWIQAPVALRRIPPGVRLQKDWFEIQKINVAEGFAKTYRGLIPPADIDIDELESIQTVLEGQFPLLSGVKKVPDIRQGGSVRIKLISGNLVLTTIGTALEPGYVSQSVRVSTAKTKKNLVGRLTEKDVVEVNL